MADATTSFDALEKLVMDASRNAPASSRAELKALFPFIGVLRKSFSEVNRLKDSVMELQEQLEKLIGPPLQYGVFLGTRPQEAERESEDEAGSTQWSLLDKIVAAASHDSQLPEDRERLDRLREDVQGLRDTAQTRRDLIVGFQGHRYEVNLTASEIPLGQLKQGQEVVLNKTMNVVAVRDHYVRGETAEVANVISAAGTARVIAVPEQGEEVEVQWAGGDKSAKFIVACTGELRKTLRRGDIVQVDDEQARVTARVKPRLHVRSGGSDGIVVEISDRLFEQGVDIGDIVRVDTHLQFAFEKLPSYETGGLALEDVPDVTFADIGGLDAQIEEIRDAIELPYLHRKLFEEYQLGRTKGIMLFGPPGCGKTMIAKAVANSLTQSIRNHLEQLEGWLSVFLRLRRNAKDKEALAQYEEFVKNRRGASELGGDTQTGAVVEPLEWLGAELRAADIPPETAEESLRRVQNTLRQEGGIRSFFLNVKGPELLSKWVGESEHRIRKIFEEAKRSATFHTPVIIFFDEMESLFRARGSGRSSDVETTIVPQFLAEMDGVEASENVVIIGASNRHDMIDPAVMRPGRLDVKVKVDRPGREASMAILALHLTPDLPLRWDGQEGCPADSPQALTFKEHVVARTIDRCAHDLAPSCVKDLLSAIPPRQDIRLAMGSGCLSSWDQEEDVQKVLTEVASREALAEAMIAEAATLLFSPASNLEAVTSDGKHHTLPLRRFISGALLASVVSRAKKGAVKRRAARGAGEVGISMADFQTALLEEFEESAEQLAVNELRRELAPKSPGQPGESVQFVEVHVGAVESNPWNVEKPRPYRFTEILDS